MPQLSNFTTILSLFVLSSVLLALYHHSIPLALISSRPHSRGWLSTTKIANFSLASRSLPFDKHIIICLCVSKFLTNSYISVHNELKHAHTNAHSLIGLCTATVCRNMRLNGWSKRTMIFSKFVLNSHNFDVYRQHPNWKWVFHSLEHIPQKHFAANGKTGY